MIQVAGADRLLTMDLHQGQIQGFFNIPVDELTAVHLLSNYFRQKQMENVVVVTDLGFAKRARTFAALLDAPLAVIEKRRVGNLDQAVLMNVIGEVRGKRAVIVDDEIDTGGTLMEVVRALQREGTEEIYACSTHGVLSGPAVERIRDSVLREVVVTDTIPLPPSKRIPVIKTLSVAPLIGEAIRRIHYGQSVGALFSARSSSCRRWSCGRTAACAPSPADPSRPRPAPATPDSEGRRPVSLKLYRPVTRGLEPSPVEQKSWRHRLRSSRWDAAPLENPEGQEAGPLGAVLLFGGLAAVTFVALVIGYGIGFWS